MTVIDLPGLVQSRDNDITTEDIKAIRQLAEHYIEKQRAIILAVISAHNDYHNQEVIEMTRQEDPDGVRTVGIITKPDVLNTGSDLYNQCLELAQNRKVVQS